MAGIGAEAGSAIDANRVDCAHREKDLTRANEPVKAAVSKRSSPRLTEPASGARGVTYGGSIWTVIADLKNLYIERRGTVLRSRPSLAGRYEKWIPHPRSSEALKARCVPRTAGRLAVCNHARAMGP